MACFTYPHKQLNHAFRRTMTHKNCQIVSKHTHPWSSSRFHGYKLCGHYGEKILMRKYCPPDFSWSFPVKLSLDVLFAIFRNATCLWLLMITASLYSPILLTHLNILMNHLYCVCVCVRYHSCWRVAPCMSQLSLLTSFLTTSFKSTQRRWNRDNSGSNK